MLQHVIGQLIRGLKGPGAAVDLAGSSVFWGISSRNPPLIFAQQTTGSIIALIKQFAPKYPFVNLVVVQTLKSRYYCKHCMCREMCAEIVYLDIVFMATFGRTSANRRMTVDENAR